MGIYDGQIEPDIQEECPECEQMHHYRDICPEIPLAETWVYGVRVVTTQVQLGHWHNIVFAGDWDCVTGDHQDREEALAHYDRVVTNLLAKVCPGADGGGCMRCRAICS